VLFWGVQDRQFFDDTWLLDEEWQDSQMLREQMGLLRSFLMYYAIPGRYGRMRHFYRPFIQPGNLCFDIGAHAGNRIRVWLALGARVVAVEPQPQLMRWLQRLYGRHPRVTLLQTAVAAQSGTATLHISSRTPTVSTLSASWIHSVQQDPSFAWVQWDRAVTVPVVTLDELIEEYGRPTLCKIDIEGYELEALHGLSQAIPTLSFEHIPAANLTTACLARLTKLGYREFNYTPGERHQFHFPTWRSATEMMASLGQLPEGSGDIYGR
jgi:FkbM family methyltransferase